MSIIVVLRTKESAAGFKADLRGAGIEASPLEGLTRFFIIEGVGVDDFPLKDHPSVESVSPGDDPIYPDEQQVIVDPDTDEWGWAAPRVIRRESPWLNPAQRTPMESTFSCKRTGEGVDIFVLDTGVKGGHPEFEGRDTQFVSAYDTLLADEDDAKHGTAVASMAAGKSVGVARGARIHAIKFTNQATGAHSSWMIKGMSDALLHYSKFSGSGRPAVLVCSWGGYTGSQAIRSAVRDLTDAGIPNVYSAGNEQTNIDSKVEYPAEADPDSFIVGASNLHDRPYYTHVPDYGTNVGFAIDLCAPGQFVKLADSMGTYRVSSGTSFAAPMVAGILACMLQGYERLTSRAEVQALKARLIDNSTKDVLNLGIYPGVYDGELALHNRLAYLDPDVTFEYIPGLTPRVG